MPFYLLKITVQRRIKVIVKRFTTRKIYVCVHPYPYLAVPGVRSATPGIGHPASIVCSEILITRLRRVSVSYEVGLT